VKAKLELNSAQEGSDLGDRERESEGNQEAGTATAGLF
jgi:hypothetical protein